MVPHFVSSYVPNIVNLNQIWWLPEVQILKTGTGHSGTIEQLMGCPVHAAQRSGNGAYILTKNPVVAIGKIAISTEAVSYWRVGILKNIAKAGSITMAGFHGR
ncbi:MAG: hypothetical protein H6557_26810 [Lewinellaceae bacterium]|nr:hypothetical protein [Phaeodactylibacter sp.]MCB9040252.1 hypothetical protein [Lewinellaceae bacterium]